MWLEEGSLSPDTAEYSRVRVHLYFQFRFYFHFRFYFYFHFHFHLHLTLPFPIPMYLSFNVQQSPSDIRTSKPAAGGRLQEDDDVAEARAVRDDAVVRRRVLLERVLLHDGLDACARGGGASALHTHARNNRKETKKGDQETKKPSVKERNAARRARTHQQPSRTARTAPYPPRRRSTTHEASRDAY